MQQELTKLRTQFSEKYPDVVQLSAEVAALEREVAAAKSREPNGEKTGLKSAPQATPLTPYVLRLKEALSEAEADIKVFKGEEQRLPESIATHQARVENVPRRDQELRELSRDYKSTGALYQS